MARSISGSGQSLRREKKTTGCRPARTDGSRCCFGSTAPRNRYSTRPGNCRTSSGRTLNEEGAMTPNRRDTISLLAGAGPAALGLLSIAGTANPGQAQQVKSTGPDSLQKIETRIGTLDFTHDFPSG